MSEHRTLGEHLDNEVEHVASRHGIKSTDEVWAMLRNAIMTGFVPPT